MREVLNGYGVMSCPMRLRDLLDSDIPFLFEMQRDAESRWMAAFGSKAGDDLPAFTLHMAKIAADENCIYKVVEHDGRVVGNVGKWVHDQSPELTYWTDKKYRGTGLTTSAVKEFLKLFVDRPIYAHTAGDNLASQAILVNVGFSKYEEVLSFSEIRNMEIVEVGYILH